MNRELNGRREGRRGDERQADWQWHGVFFAPFRATTILQSRPGVAITLQHEGVRHAHAEQGKAIFPLSLLLVRLSHGLRSKLGLLLRREGQRLLLRAVDARVERALLL